MGPRPVALMLLALALAGESRPMTRARQPLPFNHRIHAETNQIGCTLCHSYAEHSTVAGVPSMARCVGCHRFVDKDKPAVQALVKAYDEQRVIEWVRIHRLPDHVYFTHERHVAAGLSCQQCHGEVQKMDVVRQVAPLSMGWCVECHEQREASLECLACHK